MGEIGLEKYFKQIAKISVFYVAVPFAMFAFESFRQHLIHATFGEEEFRVEYIFAGG